MDEVTELSTPFVGEIVGDFVIDREIVVRDWYILESFKTAEALLWLTEGDKVSTTEAVFVDVTETVADRFTDVENTTCARVESKLLDFLTEIETLAVACSAVADALCDWEAFMLAEVTEFEPAMLVSLAFKVVVPVVVSTLIFEEVCKLTLLELASFSVIETYIRSYWKDYATYKRKFLR